ncbi:hypothetical protein GMRT_11111 [Giardia muris]|uniref:Tetratricopeptide repeat-containing protein n=1 Tax=Giardia muris TaxID=5742 RepID=A0A4Z1SSP8_GIAMU|nr:hypothetical protein GMRT_11111 [Giardia muris]|eukprot:TNJ28946.1 hypothetical protein GMRT_11111 [Giardia muris]
MHQRYEAALSQVVDGHLLEGLASLQALTSDISSSSTIIKQQGPLLFAASMAMGSILYRLERRVEAIATFKDARGTLHRHCGNQARSYEWFVEHGIAKCYLALGQWEEAIRCLLKALALLRPALDIDGSHTTIKAELHKDLAVASFRQENWSDALLYSRMALKHYVRSQPNGPQHAALLVLTGDILCYVTKASRAGLREALTLFHQAVQIYKAGRQKPKKEDLSYLEDSYPPLTSPSRERGLLTVYALISRCLLLLHRRSDGELYAYKAEQLLKTQPLIDGMSTEERLACNRDICHLVDVCQRGVLLADEKAPITNVQDFEKELTALAEDSPSADLIHAAATTLYLRSKSHGTLPTRRRNEANEMLADERLAEALETNIRAASTPL